MSAEQTALAALAELDRALNRQPDADVRNLHRLRDLLHYHTAAICRVIACIVRAFPDRKLVFLVEAELAQLGWTARPKTSSPGSRGWASWSSRSRATRSRASAPSRTT